MQEALPLVLTVAPQHGGVVESRVQVSQCLVGAPESNERMCGARALQRHGVGLTLGPGRPFACARVCEEGLRLVAHGRLVCHPSTMAHVTSAACQGWPSPNPQGIPWPTSLSRHVDVTGASCDGSMV